MRLAWRLVIALIPVIAFAQTGEPVKPHDFWGAWEFDPAVVALLAVSALLYAKGAGGRPEIRPVQRCCFWSGLAVLAIALISPVHALGQVLFTAHMIQHELLMVVAAPLLVLSRPLVAFLWAFPIDYRRELGRWSKVAAVRGVWLFLTAPLAAWWLHALAIWAWHLPALFEATLHSDLVHTAQHLSFFLTALLFWWSLFYAHGPRAYGSAVLSLFTTAMHTGALGALLTFAPRVWYRGYELTTTAWGLTALEDQRLGGLIMWVPASLAYITAALVLFALWMRTSDRRLEGAFHAN